MSGKTRELTLLVPGLFDGVAAHSPEYLSELLASRPAPSKLARLLSRADFDHRPHADIDALLGGHFNMPESQLAVGALSRLGENAGDMQGDGLWLRADPVYLHPDMSQLLLMAGDKLEISKQEAAVYIDELNSEFAARGWRFQAPDAGRWYLHIPDTRPDIGEADFASLHEVNGGNVLPFMPGGESGAKWRAVLNEIQVLLHSCAVNESREQRGLPPINGVWLWGAGALPKPSRVNWAGVWSDYSYARGLGLLNNCPVFDLPERFADWSGGAQAGEHLLVLPTPPEVDDEIAWLDCLQALERNWFGAVLDGLRAGELNAVRVWPSHDTCYTLTRRAAKRWWRRDKSLLALIQHVT